MILNLKSCYMRNVNPNPSVFIRVKNDSTGMVKFLIQYKQMVTPIIKESSSMKPGEVEQLTFPVSAREISVTIFDVSWYHFEIIHNEEFPDSRRVCFEVTGNSPNLMCWRVPCR